MQVASLQNLTSGSCYEILHSLSVIRVHVGTETKCSPDNNFGAPPVAQILPFFGPSIVHEPLLNVTSYDASRPGNSSSKQSTIPKEHGQVHQHRNKIALLL
uniref:Uncharacterized protein n=1 Tax=Arundo donax TaxID=35708 RepID=A0A0A9VG17_ARUDO